MRRGTVRPAASSGARGPIVLFVAALLVIGAIGGGPLSGQAVAGEECALPVGKEREDCFFLDFSQALLGQMHTAVIKADRIARAQEARAERATGPRARQEWKKAAMLRQDARIAVLDALNVASVNQRFADENFATPSIRRQYDRVFRASVREWRRLLPLMKRQVAANLFRVARPGFPLPVFTSARRAVGAARAARRGTVADVRKTVGGPPPVSSLDAGIGDYWAVHVAIAKNLRRKLVDVADSTTKRRASGSLRRVQVARLLALRNAYRRQIRIARALVLATGGTCGAPMLESLRIENARRKAIDLLILSHRRNSAALRKRAVRAWNSRSEPLRTANESVQSCLDGAPPPVPTPAPGLPGLPGRSMFDPAQHCPASIRENPSGDDWPLITSGHRASIVLGHADPAKSDGKATSVRCNYSADGSSNTSSFVMGEVLLHFPGDFVASLNTAGQCGTSPGGGVIVQSSTHYLEAAGNPSRMQDVLGWGAEAVAKAEAAGVAIPCSWTSSDP